MMISQVSTVVTANATKGTSGVGQSQPVKASEAVKPPPGAEASRAAEVSTQNGLKAGSSQAVDEQAVEEIVDDLNEFAQQVERQLQFSVDKQSGKTVIRVIDAATDELVRQIPADEILELQRRLGDVQGLLFKTEA